MLEAIYFLPSGSDFDSHHDSEVPAGNGLLHLRNTIRLSPKENWTSAHRDAERATTPGHQTMLLDMKTPLLTLRLLNRTIREPLQIC